MDGETKSGVAIGCCLILLFGLLVIGIGGCNAVCSTIDYSDGYRDGTVQKFSKKGLIFKTWEGEMVMSRLVKQENGSLGMATFDFSVEDPKVAATLEKLPPEKSVRLHYHQVLSAWSPRGNTNYFITKVELLDTTDQVEKK